MTLYCCSCKNLVYPQFAKDTEINWCVCDNCNIYKLTNEQKLLFESTVNKLLYAQLKMIININWTEEIVQAHIDKFEDRYAKVDI
jgi:hypothetical protein